MLKYIARVFARQIVRRIAIVIVGALFMLAPALWGGLQANAASIYDTAFLQTDELIVSQDRSWDCDPLDITHDWADYINSESRWVLGQSTWAPEIRTSFQNALNNGRWGVSLDSVSFSGQAVASIYWTEDDSLTLDWQDGTLVTTYAYNANIVCSDQYSGGDEKYTIFPNGWDGTKLNKTLVTVSNTNGAQVKNLFFYGDTNLPAGYEGIIPRDTPPEPPEPPVTGEEYTPDWVVLSATDWNAEIRDKRFFTFDGIFWTCSIDGTSLIDDDSGITPGIEWELWDNNNVMVDSGSIGAAAAWTYQFPKHQAEREYTLKGRYFCGSDENVTPVYFGDIGEKTFTITATGVLGEQDFFADCFSEEFPFIHMNACVHNLAAVVNALSFGVIKVNGFDSNDSCRQLQTLGNWINKPGETICPQFPSYVRDTVTPFVMFILGILTAIFVVSYLNKRGID